MSDLKNWADNAELNVESSPNGWPEGMPPSAVNNSAREMMAALRRSYVRQPWFAPGGTIVRASTSQITIADDAKVTNYSNYYTVGARVRVETTGGDYVLGRVTESQYEAPTSTITFTLDAEADLPSVITDVYVGLSPEDVSGIAGPNLLGCIIGFSEESDKIGAGLLFANGQAFSPTLYPDLAQLYYQGDDENDKPIYKYGRELHGDVYWPLRPDVRGYFPRFVDDRFVDIGGVSSDQPIDPDAPRTVGSTQGASIPSHSHGLKADTNIGGGYSSNTGYISAGTYAASANRGIWSNTYNAENPNIITPYEGLGDANEVRPDNIALVGVIVAYGGVITSGLADVSELEEYCTAERVLAQEAAGTASTAATHAEQQATAAAGSATSASDSATLAQQWAVKMDGQVANTDYSSKYYADLAHKWATSSTVVESGQYGASYYALRAYNYANAAETARDTARDWATKVDGAVSGSDYSAKYNANAAATSATAASNSATSAQNWAVKMDGAVSGTSYSSKYYATQAAASATEAANIVASIGPVMRYRGSVATYADLPTATAVTGDVYNVTADGKNYAFTAGGTWDDFGGAITVSIAGCTDVSLTSLADGEVLIYNSSTSKWENSQLRQTFRGVYDATVQYHTGDIVQNSVGSSDFLIAVQDSLGAPVNNRAYWWEITNDHVVNYREKSDDVEYRLGCVEYDGATGTSYYGGLTFTRQTSPTINASTGTLTAASLKTTTQSQGDNSTNVATTAYVDAAVAGATGSIKKETYTNPALTATNGVCTWTVTHTLGSRDFFAIVYDTTTYKEVMFEGVHTDTTTFTINLTSSSNIASGAYKVVMIG